MSLYESGDSLGEASLIKIANNTQRNCTTHRVELLDLAKMIVRGGWPENLDIDYRLVHILPRSYINAILAKDISGDGVNRDTIKMMMLLKSLARNESTVSPNSTLVADAEDLNRNLVSEYLEVLNKLYLIENQEAFSSNLRSREVVGKMPKRHFVDPSIACAVLGITPDKLVNDIKTGTEVDAIIELEDGRVGAVEIKLGPNGIEDAKKSLANFEAELTKTPDFKCIIVWGGGTKKPQVRVGIT